MSQKQMLAAVVGVALMVVALVVVSRNIGERSASTVATPSQSTPKKMSDTAPVAPAPENADGIVSAIDAQTSVDTSALNDEEAGSLNQVDEDSSSVTNLGTSYDENNL